MEDAPVDSVTDQIIGAAICLHKKYGPGLLESVYTLCLAQELLVRGLGVEVAKPLSLEHDGFKIHRACALVHLLVEGQVIVEVKCVSRIAPIHVAQLLTYLRLTDLKVGLLLNFNVTKLITGVRRVANGYVDGSESETESISASRVLGGESEKNDKITGAVEMP